MVHADAEMLVVSGTVALWRMMAIGRLAKTEFH